jgi:hypothetical protein
MNIFKISFFIFLVILSLSGCAYRHYLGMHGPSVKRHPDIHAKVTRDKECLMCHNPEMNPNGPLNNHPQFIGCLRCHNDDLD